MKDFHTNCFLRLNRLHRARRTRASTRTRLERARCIAATCELRFRARRAARVPAAFATPVGKFACTCACVHAALERNDDATQLKLARARQLTLRAADWVVLEGRGPTQSFTPCTSYAIANSYHLPAKWWRANATRRQPALSRKESRLAFSRTRFIKRKTPAEQKS